MADLDSTSYVQRINLDDFPAITLLWNFSSKLISYFRIFGKKLYPGKWHIPGYPNIASIPPPGLDQDEVGARYDVRKTSASDKYYNNLSSFRSAGNLVQPMIFEF